MDCRSNWISRIMFGKLVEDAQYEIKKIYFKYVLGFIWEFIKFYSDIFMRYFIREA